ncbi:MAG: LysR family transcriptional regulator [Pseudomonadota bacterium]
MIPSNAPKIHQVLTPDALHVIATVHRTGSMAAAAREMGLVPSAVTYRVRQVEDALDVLLFDRSSRQAKLTEAGKELLREGTRLLGELDAVANRVKRVATGWEPQLTLAVDTIICRTTVMELCESFYAQETPTRVRLRDEALSGTLQALTSGQADLALGVSIEAGSDSSIHSKVLGRVEFVYAVAPHHSLATAMEPLSDAQILAHRAVAVADSVQRGSGITVGLLGGQDVLTVPSMSAKLEAQLRGLGGGFLPTYLARPHIDAGHLVVKAVARPSRVVRVSYAWRHVAGTTQGRALQWWLKHLEHTATRTALLQQPHAL